MVLLICVCAFVVCVCVCYVFVFVCCAIEDLLPSLIAFAPSDKLGRTRLPPSHPNMRYLFGKQNTTEKRKGRVRLNFLQFICLCVVSCVLVCYVARSDVQQRVCLGSWIVRKGCEV